MTTTSESPTEDDEANPPAADEPIPTLVGHHVDLPPDVESTQKVPRFFRRSRWRRNALAGAVLLGLGAGTLLTIAPPRGLPGWLPKLGGKSPGEAEARPDPTAGTGGSPLPETRSLLPAPTPAIPEPAIEEVAPVEAALPAGPPEPEEPTLDPAEVSKAKARAAAKSRKAADRKRRARSRLPDDSTVEVELF